MLFDTPSKQNPCARFVCILHSKRRGVIPGTTLCRSGCSKSLAGDRGHDKILQELYIGGANNRYGAGNFARLNEDENEAVNPG